MDSRPNLCYIAVFLWPDEEAFEYEYGCMGELVSEPCHGQLIEWDSFHAVFNCCSVGDFCNQNASFSEEFVLAVLASISPAASYPSVAPSSVDQSE